MNLTTYQSQKAWPEKRWLAHMELGKGIFMSFFGKTEEEALAKANTFWQTETERQKVLMADALVKPVAEAGKDEIQSTGRGSHFVGKVWMIHNQSREKIRIDQSEVSLYEGRGYVAFTLMRNRTNFKTHYWVNVYYDKYGFVRKRAFTRRKFAIRALLGYDRKAKDQIVIRFHIKPKRRSK